MLHGLVFNVHWHDVFFCGVFVCVCVCVCVCVYVCVLGGPLISLGLFPVRFCPCCLVASSKSLTKPQFSYIEKIEYILWWLLQFITSV